MSPLEPFEKKMIEAFPYYSGLAENAIQYLVDTELDDNPGAEDSGTICHQRMERDTWSEESLIRIPGDWVFDHAARDIAEYMRAHICIIVTTCSKMGFCFCRNMSKLRRYPPFPNACFTAACCFRSISSRRWRAITFLMILKNSITKSKLTTFLPTAPAMNSFYRHVTT